MWCQSAARREGVPRHGGLCVAERKQRASEVVRPRLQRDVRHRAAGPSELRIVIARRDADGFDRLGRGNHEGQVAAVIAVIRAFELHVVRLPLLPVDVARQAVVRVVELRMRTEGPRRARHDRQRALEVPIERERQLRDLLALDDAARVGAIGLQHGRLARDRDRLFELTDGQRDVHANRGVHVDFHIVATEFPETDELSLDAIRAR